MRWSFLSLRKMTVRSNERKYEGAFREAERHFFIGGFIKETWDNPKAPPVSETMTTYHKQRTKWYTDSLYKNEVTDSRETFYVKTVIRDV